MTACSTAGNGWGILIRQPARQLAMGGGIPTASRRINKEVKVLAAVWVTEFFPFLVELAVLQ